jgi:hypothetical protein
MFVFKHPKYYTELRKLRNKEAQSVPGCLPTNELHKSDQAISKRQPTGESERASWSGPQAPSSKPQASSSKPQASSTKSIKPQATSFKPQA